MQAQAVRPEQSQDVLTATQSLQSIQTLLRAGLGCITYLRNLLPADNFSESYLTSAAADPLPSAQSESFSSDGGRRNVSGFKIMTVTRGFTEEADKLLDYLEHGIFDALQKQYLRSFIFAVYLDSQDPNNIVEAYTFNFHYHTIPGSNVTIPVMSLGDELMKLSLSGKKKGNDPVADASKQGKLPTLGEVKRSLKTLIKNLIQATTQMDALPRRRFATFKLFYHDHTPDDYEPPHFRAGDARKDKWYFATHDKTEVPEKCSVGQVQTGWHGVDLRVASVSGYLPSAEDNNAPFMGTTVGAGHGHSAPPLTPAEEVEVRRQQAEAQRDDAQNRRIVWDAEEGLSDVDAEGEDDDGDDSQLMGVWRMSSAGLEFLAPMGMLDDDGNIVPLPQDDNEDRIPTPTEPALYKGVEEKVPRHIGQLDLPATNSGELTQTQCLDQTQRADADRTSQSPFSSPLSTPEPGTPITRKVSFRSHAGLFDSGSLPPSDPIGLSVPSNGSFREDETVDTQMLKDHIMAQENADDDAEMLDTNTQVQPYYASDNDPVQSFSTSRSLGEVIPDSQPDVPMDNAGEDRLECECGVNNDDCDWLLCESDCHRWFHSWCMGYHSGQSEQLPTKFICFDCRVRADRNWDLIVVHGLHTPMMERFRDLALFRRAIKVCEETQPENLSAFTKTVGCETIVAGQLFKRLENEGFIALEDAHAEDSALRRGRSSKNKNTTKTVSRRRTTRKRYVFVDAIRNESKYNDYFDPDSEVEKKLLGLEELKPKRRSQRKVTRGNDEELASNTISQEVPHPPGPEEVSLPSASQDASQTQEETQLAMESQPQDALKRHTDVQDDDDVHDTRKTKKVKISIGPPVDLGD